MFLTNLTGLSISEPILVEGTLFILMENINNLLPLIYGGLETGTVLL